MIAKEHFKLLWHMRLTFPLRAITQCPARKRRFINEPEAEVKYVERSDQSDAIFGHVTIHDSSSFRRYWYRCTEDGLVLAVYQCKAEKFAAAEVEIGEAHAIAGTMELKRE